MAERTMYQRFTLFSLLLPAIMGGCGYDRFDDLKLSDNQYIDANIGIGTLRTWHGDDGRIKHVYDDFVIAGWVTAEDKSDNFYRSFVIEDLTGAIEVRAGFYDLHTAFVRDRQVMVRLKNLDVDIYNGVLRLGRMRYDELDYVAVRYIPGEYFLPQSSSREVSPREFTVEGLSDGICGRLVRITALRSIDTEPVTWAGERIFRDGNGNEIVVSTSGYADFADKKIPHGELALTGILTRNSSRYTLKIRDINDVKINGDEVD